MGESVTLLSCSQLCFFFTFLLSSTDSPSVRCCVVLSKSSCGTLPPIVWYFTLHRVSPMNSCTFLRCVCVCAARIAGEPHGGRTSPSSGRTSPPEWAYFTTHVFACLLAPRAVFVSLFLVVLVIACVCVIVCLCVCVMLFL